ncbi:glycogen debranching N-terminal domain-containing protein [Leifsonia sp. H3M29-4]|uniref:amylo-alpha-1,6-glucosidase n=1 Tax=Salinibacterium metalliresistens TaxID=3031321 RepID=UPI0023DCD1DD|nr:glycogen debranching N-terminal domain-containing protein [Salinibacterium metalliresistens]MDF1479854.1 glycogen debranching N-terminal domain-containing protein [Salinibacterium metalliresistens]
MAGWNEDTLAGTAGPDAVTIIEGAAFCVSHADGDMEAGRPHGLFMYDTRLVSTWTTRINGHPIEVLSAMVREPYHATLLGRVHHGDAEPDGSLLVRRERWVGVGLRERIALTNSSPVPVEVLLEVTVETDFADVFDVKASRPMQAHTPEGATVLHGLAFEGGAEHEFRGVIVESPGAAVEGQSLLHRTRLGAHETWTTTFSAVPTRSGVPIVARSDEEQPQHEREIERRFMAWHEDAPSPTVENDAIETAIRRGQSDLGSLRIFDPAHPDRQVIAAGAPWFMALFGRDSILTSIMSLAVDPSLALGTLRTLGDLQGSIHDPRTEEQPGKILHEVRLGASVNAALGGRTTYFGTVDATPLFVVALGELAEWGASTADIAALLPHADLALRWMTTHGDADRDGFIEYQRSDELGLHNQGWKDSWDAISFADGTLAEPPIALCEVQGYAYAAFRARAGLARAVGDAETAERWDRAAATLKERFNEQFWMADRQYFAIALDRDKRQVDACASNMGHCLWSGIVDDDKAPHVAERLLSDQMFGGWGVRTLATDMARYNPASYHNGSVWPHDNAIIAAGLMRYGFVEAAQRVALAIFDASEHFGARLPELFCGFSRESYERPVPYPNACSPQAWAAAAPISLVRTLLRLEADVPNRQVWLAPALPASFGGVQIDNVRLAGARVRVEVAGGMTRLSGLPEGISVHAVPRYGER